MQGYDQGQQPVDDLWDHQLWRWMRQEEQVWHLHEAAQLRGLDLVGDKLRWQLSDVNTELQFN